MSMACCNFPSALDPVCNRGGLVCISHFFHDYEDMTVFFLRGMCRSNLPSHQPPRRLYLCGKQQVAILCGLPGSEQHHHWRPISNVAGGLRVRNPGRETVLQPTGRTERLPPGGNRRARQTQDRICHTQGALDLLVQKTSVRPPERTRTFQRLMDRVIGGHRWQATLIYIDDPLVYSTDWESHFMHLRSCVRGG